MAYWLFKSEPNTWSWNDQLAKADAGEGWDGVRNHQAGNNMKAMEIGDLGFFYHSVSEKLIIETFEIDQYFQNISSLQGMFLKRPACDIRIDRKPSETPKLYN